MNKITYGFILLLCSSLAISSPLKEGYYLKWDTDHTERQIRPAYPVSPKDIEKFATYRLKIDEDGNPLTVCFYLYAKPSNKSDFGAHCIHFVQNKGTIDRVYYDTEGTQIVNANGIYIERYEYEDEKYPVRKIHLDKELKLTDDRTGVAEYRFKRDPAGRRKSELRLNKNGEIVPEHNGFYEARFAFDDNDYAKYRKGYNKEGLPMEGPGGYATAYFWFDKNGTFLKEEFRDINNNLVIFPRGGYARIEYRKIDRYGNWHELALFNEKEKPLNKHASKAIAKYDGLNRRKSILFFDIDMKPAENKRGVAKYIYSYNQDGSFQSRKGYSAENVLVNN